MGFIPALARIFGIRPQKMLAELTAGERIEFRLLHERDSRKKEGLQFAYNIIFEDTGTVISKITKAKSAFNALKNTQPLVWADLVLALYQQGHPVFDEVLGSQMRDALAVAKYQLTKVPHKLDQENLAAIKKDIEKFKLTSLRFLDEDAPKAAESSVLGITTMSSAVRATETSQA